MDITDLISGSDSNKLIELVNKLKELAEKENELMNKASELIEKGNKLEKNKFYLNNNGRNYLNVENGKTDVIVDSPSDSDELINIITKSIDYSSEKEEIEKEADLICKELEKNEEEKTKIKEKINELLSYSSGKNIGINVESVGTMHIIDGNPINEGDKVLQDLCEIIKCSGTFANDMHEIFKKNVTDISLGNDINPFTKLKTYKENYNYDKNKYESQLEIVSKTEEKSEAAEELSDETEDIKDPVTLEVISEVREDSSEGINDKEEINIDVPKKELPIVEEDKIDSKIINFKNEPEEELSDETEEQSNNEINTDNIIQFKKEEPEKVAVIKDPVTLEVISEVKEDGSKVERDNIVPLSDIIKKKTYITDKMEKNKVVTATKQKYNGTIYDIWSGSYPETEIERVDSVNEVKVDDNFNMDNFVSNVAA